MSERTLVLVKPDGVARGLVGEVLGRLERKGYRLVACELRTLTAEIAQAHYAEHAEKPFFGELVAFITSGPLLAAVAEGPDVIEAWRTMMGATEPGQGRAGDHPGRPGQPDHREHRARLGLAGVGRARDRAVLPRPGLASAARGIARACPFGFWGPPVRRYDGPARSDPLGRRELPHGEQHVVHRP